MCKSPTQVKVKLCTPALKILASTRGNTSVCFCQILRQLMLVQWNLSIATTFGPQTSGINREVVSLPRLKSIVQALLGHNQVVFIERWSPDAGGFLGRFHCNSYTWTCTNSTGLLVESEQYSLNNLGQFMYFSAKINLDRHLYCNSTLTYKDVSQEQVQKTSYCRIGTITY